MSRLLLAATFSGIALGPAASAQTAVVRESLAGAPTEALRAAYLVRPDVAERRPAVVISHGRRELAEDLKALADRIAGRGYGVLLQGPPSPASRPDDLERIRAAVAYVADRPWADDTRVVLVGFCGGGYQSLLLAAEADRPYAAVVSFYGPLTVPDRMQPDEGPAFRDVFEVLGDVQAPVQGHYGDSDEIIPTADARRLEETLRARGRQAEVFVYEGAEHGFCDHTHGHYDEDACRRATARLFTFLDERLGGGVAADVASPEAIVSAAYDSLARAPGEPFRWDRFRSLFLSEAILLPNTEQTDGEPRVLSPEGFIEWIEGYYAENAPIGSPEDKGFAEEAVHNEVLRYGDIAQVLSTYQRHFWNDDQILGRGINSFQLVYRDSRWWIVSIAWDEEEGAGPIPTRYLE